MTLECEWKKTRPGQTSVPLTELKSMLDQVGLNLPNSKVMSLTEELKCSNKTDGNNLSKKEFLQVSYSQSVCLSGELTHILIVVTQICLPLVSHNNNLQLIDLSHILF